LYQRLAVAICGVRKSPPLPKELVRSGRLINQGAVGNRPPQWSETHDNLPRASRLSAWPEMNEAALNELAADIKANGQHEPATVSPDGQLLDGRTPAPRPSPRHAPAL